MGQPYGSLQPFTLGAMVQILLLKLLNTTVDGASAPSVLLRSINVVKR